MRILIVKLSSIGDVIHTLPALAELRRHFPLAEISWIVERSSAPLLRQNPLLDHLIEIDTRAWRREWPAPRTWRAILSVIERLRSHQFDVGFDFQGLLKSGFVLHLSGARRRIGFETACMREKASLMFLTEQVPVSDDGHVIEKNLQLVRVLGLEPGAAYEFPMHIPEEDRHIVDRKLRLIGADRLALINPGGAWKGKRWSPESYAAICDFLFEGYGLVALVTHAPDEEELAREVVSGAIHSSAIPFSCTLRQLAALADRAALFVGGDTGPLHVAAARGTPIVAIFGPTPARRNGPFCPADIVVQDFDIVPTTYYRHLSDDYLNVSVDQVKQAIERRLASANTTEPNQPPRTIATRAN
jgi:lipopolysaccharide heptosyltransferase I